MLASGWASLLRNSPRDLADGRLYKPRTFSIL